MKAAAAAGRGDARGDVRVAGLHGSRPRDPSGRHQRHRATELDHRPVSDQGVQGTHRQSDGRPTLRSRSNDDCWSRCREAGPPSPGYASVRGNRDVTLRARKRREACSPAAGGSGRTPGRLCDPRVRRFGWVLDGWERVGSRNHAHQEFRGGTSTFDNSRIRTMRKKVMNVGRPTCVPLARGHLRYGPFKGST